MKAKPRAQAPGRGLSSSAKARSLSQPAGRLHGIIPPLVTPLRDRDTLDAAGLERLIEHVLSGGVHGLFVLGTTGEGPSLSYRLRREVISRTCRQVGNRVPVLVGITDTAFVESVRLAQHAADEGAQAVVTSAPYYFPTGQPELLEFLGRLVPELPLPLFLYNMPMMTKTQFEPDTLRQVLPVQKVIGVKDSSGDLAYFSRVVELAKARPDWVVFMGPEHLLAEALKRGGHGGVSGGALVYPRLLVDLYEAAMRGDWVSIGSLQPRLLQLGQIYQVGRHASAVIKGIKCALSLLGVCNDAMAEPFSPFRQPERDRVGAILNSLGLVAGANGGVLKCARRNRDRPGQKATLSKEKKAVRE
jgi:dihydrodipicolinate synthase/N-acetylneuraminate lyase